jgi:hypothetical protein
MRWVAKLVRSAPASYGSSLDSNPDMSRKNKIYYRSTLARQKNIQKNYNNPPGLRIRIHFIRIRIQHFRLNTDADPIRIQGFYDKKFKKKITAEQNFLFVFDQKLLFTYL